MPHSCPLAEPAKGPEKVCKARDRVYGLQGAAGKSSLAAGLIC